MPLLNTPAEFHVRKPVRVLSKLSESRLHESFFDYSRNFGACQCSIILVLCQLVLVGPYVYVNSLLNYILISRICCRQCLAFADGVSTYGWGVQHEWKSVCESFGNLSILIVRDDATGFCQPLWEFNLFRKYCITWCESMKNAMHNIGSIHSVSDANPTRHCLQLPETILRYLANVYSTGLPKCHQLIGHKCEWRFSISSKSYITYR